MDEPLASLDAPRKAEVLPYIERLAQEFALPVLYVSHSIEEVTRLADHLVIVSEGRTVASGELSDIMSRPEHSPLIGRYEAGSVLDCGVQHNDDYALTTLQVCRRPAARAAHRPRSTVSRCACASVHATWRSRCRVRWMCRSATSCPGASPVYHAARRPYADVAVDLGSTSLRALVTRESCDRLGLQPGTAVWAMVKSVALDSRSVGFNRRPRPDRATPAARIERRIQFLQLQRHGIGGAPLGGTEQRDQPLAERREFGSARALRPAGAGFHHRFREQTVHVIHKQPRLAIRHAHGARRARDRSDAGDAFQQFDLARPQTLSIAEMQAQRRQGGLGWRNRLLHLRTRSRGPGQRESWRRSSVSIVHRAPYPGTSRCNGLS
jgi:molybdopterin-binding protein